MLYILHAHNTYRAIVVSMYQHKTGAGNCNKLNMQIQERHIIYEHQLALTIT